LGIVVVTKKREETGRELALVGRARPLYPVKSSKGKKGGSLKAGFLDTSTLSLSAYVSTKL